MTTILERLGPWLLCWSFVLWVVQVGPELLTMVRTLAHTTLGGLVVFVLVLLSLAFLLPDAPDEGPLHVTDQP